MQKIGLNTTHVTVWTAGKRFLSYPHLCKMIRVTGGRGRGKRYTIDQYSAKILQKNLDKQFLNNVYWECAR